jgi:hypothetical protein
LLIDEWLTDNRARLFKKCKELKAMKLIKDCYTNNGEVWAKTISKPGTILRKLFDFTKIV